ncbi:MAG: secondary thiamine-phosphate synthase enzyme YjbQ [Ignavibacteriae bacterium]|nr:secondary thiamine-phosphate synthase enzyme YjbQ [Ignavibacteriota bacterium]MCB9244755.1 YjbQ family protein [Ignavibacteriales bacterium]
MTKFIQKEFKLKPYSRGFHIITGEVVREIPELKDIRTGMCHVFIKHTSASLTINENADPTVRKDFESYFNRCVPEDEPYYLHNYEGSDDMPAHIKSSMMGNSVTVPVTKGELNLGTWQGIYLCEHRDNGGARKIVVTIWGD